MNFSASIGLFFSKLGGGNRLGGPMADAGLYGAGTVVQDHGWDHQPNRC